VESSPALVYVLGNILEYYDEPLTVWSKIPGL